MKNFPQLAGMNIFVLYLKGMKVNADNLRAFKTLSDGEYRHVTSRNADSLNNREIVFIVEEVETKKAGLYERLASNTFQPLYRK